MGKTYWEYANGQKINVIKWKILAPGGLSAPAPGLYTCIFS